MNNAKLPGKRIVITGGASGLGYAMAHALERAGASVLIRAVTLNPPRQAVATLQQEGSDACARPMDVRSKQPIQTAVEWVAEHRGDLDMLVNNAGIGMRTVNPVFLTDP